MPTLEASISDITTHKTLCAYNSSIMDFYVCLSYNPVTILSVKYHTIHLTKAQLICYAK